MFSIFLKNKINEHSTQVVRKKIIKIQRNQHEEINKNNEIVN